MCIQTLWNKTNGSLLLMSVRYVYKYVRESFEICMASLPTFEYQKCVHVCCLVPYCIESYRCELACIFRVSRHSHLVRLLLKQVQWNISVFSLFYFIFPLILWEVLCFESAMRSFDFFISIWMNHNFTLFVFHFIPFLSKLVLIHFIHVGFSGKFQFKWQHFSWARVLYTATNDCHI